MFLKYSRTEDRLGQNQNDVMLADESFSLLPFKKIFFGSTVAVSFANDHAACRHV